MASMPAVIDGKAQEHCKRRQQARLRRLVVDENAQQHRPYYLITAVLSIVQFLKTEGAICSRRSR